MWIWVDQQNQCFFSAQVLIRPVQLRSYIHHKDTRLEEDITTLCPHNLCSHESMMSSVNYPHFTNVI